MTRTTPPFARAGRVILLALSTVLAAVLAFVMLNLAPAPDTVPALVAQRLADSGVSHPVTAVLLNFRGYDTLLEIAVLLLAVLGALALRAQPVRPVRPPEPVLVALVRAVVPLMVLVAGYLLWAGAHQPGGAFQAGAVLGAAGVLLRLAGLLPGLLPAGVALRAGLVAGLLLFLAVAAGAFATGAALLEYPRTWAGALITLIELALTVSIGLMLVGLFLGAPEPAPARRPRR